MKQICVLINNCDLATNFIKRKFTYIASTNFNDTLIRIKKTQQ